MHETAKTFAMSKLTCWHVVRPPELEQGGRVHVAGGDSQEELPALRVPAEVVCVLPSSSCQTECFSFKMNGKGLSMLTMEMFSARAPCGGKTLFKVSGYSRSDNMTGTIKILQTASLHDFRIFK